MLSVLCFGAMPPLCCLLLICCSLMSSRATPIFSGDTGHLAPDSEQGGEHRNASSPISEDQGIDSTAVDPRGQSLLLTALGAALIINSDRSFPTTRQPLVKQLPTHSTIISEQKYPRQGRSLLPAIQLAITITPMNASKAEKQQKWYHSAGWLPSKDSTQERSVNLTVLPMLAFAFFVFGVCIRCYSWVRDQDRHKDRGQLDFEDADELNYTIITAGEHGYREVDLRSDTTSMYDTVTSFRSFRLPFNEQHTVTSIKSLPNQPFETYRSIVLQKANEGVYDSVHSYKAFLEKVIKMKDDVDIEVELVNDYSPRPRSKSYSGSEAAPNRSRKRRMRRHTGGRSIVGGAKTMAEKERFRRHSGNSVPQSSQHPPGDIARGKNLYRRSSPAVLDPVVQEGDSRSDTGQSDAEQDDEVLLPGSCHPFQLDRHPSSSSSSTGGSSTGSSHKHWVKDPTAAAINHRLRREKRRQKRASQDMLAEKEKTGKGAFKNNIHHRHRHCSDDSPRSSSPSDTSNSNEVHSESESDITDSGLVVDIPQADLSPSPKSPKILEFPRPMSFPNPVELPERYVELPRRPSKQSCFKYKGAKNGQGLVGQASGGDSGQELTGEAVTDAARKVARFKVSFVDDATLSPTTSDGE